MIKTDYLRIRLLEIIIDKFFNIFNKKTLIVKLTHHCLCDYIIFICFQRAELFLFASVITEA